MLPPFRTGMMGLDLGLAGAIIPTLHKLHSNCLKIAEILTARLHAPCRMRSQ